MSGACVCYTKWILSLLGPVFSFTNARKYTYCLQNLYYLSMKTSPKASLIKQMYNVDPCRVSGTGKLLLSVCTPRNEAQTLSQEEERSFLPTAHIFLLAQQFPQRHGGWHPKLAVIPCQQMWCPCVCVPAAWASLFHFLYWPIHVINWQYGHGGVCWWRRG